MSALGSVRVTRRGYVPDPFQRRVGFSCSFYVFSHRNRLGKYRLAILRIRYPYRQEWFEPCKFLDGAHGEAVGAVVVQRVDATRVEVQVAPVRHRVRHRRPRIAVARNVVQRAGRVVAVARNRDTVTAC